MSYQKLFPEILEKTYSSCKNISNQEVPLVKITKWLNESKNISLPFVDVLTLEKMGGKERNRFPEGEKVEIRLSESNKNFKQIEKDLLSLKFGKNFVKGHIVSELTTKEDFWKRFHKHTRNDIRKAEKSGLKIKRINSMQELKEFYKLYFKQMKKFGTPQHSLKFFKNCFEMMSTDFIGLNCYKDKKLIGSIILFIENEYVYVSFNVSDGKFRNFRPNDLLYWEALKWAIKKEKKLFDIGQVDINPEKGTRAEALLKFKKKWLGKEYKKIYFTRGFKISQSNKDNLKKFRKIWKILPDFIIKLIGPKICSQLG